MNEFDFKAVEWDKNPMHWDRSEAIANEIIKRIPLNRNMSALEYGAGTGITSFLLRDKVKEITLMDNSSEMIKVMNNKIRASNVTNLKTLNVDLEHEDYEGGTFDLIFTQMVLHHVINIENILEKFSKLLRKGGYLAIADLYSEDGSFHGEGFEGHRGFDVAELSKTILKNSFNDISHEECYVINRKISETENRQYPVFLIIARKVI